MEQTAELKRAILRLLAERAPGKTICPSEAARAVGGDEETTWRPLMEPARCAARELAKAGDIVVTQRGHVVDAENSRGAIRLRLP